MQKRTLSLALCLAVLTLTAVAVHADGDRLHRHHKMIEMIGHKGGFLGVQLTDLTPELRAHFGAPEDAGVMVSKVVADSAAERAGVKVGDVITRVNGEDVDSSMAVKHAIVQLEDGAAADLEIWRDGRVETLSANVEAREGHNMGDHHVLRRALKLACEDGEDCDVKFQHFSGLQAGCGGGGNCEVVVDCDDDGDCDCTVNGEDADCEGLHEHHE